MQTLAAIVVTTVVFLGLDAIWLKTVIGPFFRERIGGLMREDPLLGHRGWLLCDLSPSASSISRCSPALNSGNLWLAVFNGAFLGLLGYGTYEATSMSIMKDWQWDMLILDVAWGTGVCAVSAAAGYFAANAVG